MKPCCIVRIVTTYWSMLIDIVTCSFAECEHPIVCQLGGGDPEHVGEAARIVAAKGYDAINLNCGCPSTKVFVGTVKGCKCIVT